MFTKIAKYNPYGHVKTQDGVKIKMKWKNYFNYAFLNKRFCETDILK